MAEYIEREAHCKKCIHYDICDSYSGLDIVTFFPHNEDCEYFKPAADVVEVRHGEWLPSPDGLMPTLCGNCGEPALFEYVCEVFGIDGFYRCKSKYRPNCGAKMDGKGEGE